MEEKIDSTPHLIDVKNLSTYFYTDDGVVRAVDGVDLKIKPGETLGVVGESGCGKSVTALSMMRLVPFPGRIVQGQILYQDNGENLDLTTLDAMGKRMRAIRGGGMAMIFQEPMSSLNPVFTIGNQIIEVIMAHQRAGKREARERAIAMLEKVEIPGPRQTVNKYPHQLSGGMRQRAMIAMALSCNPALLIADEPTTALDVTVQAQVLDLLMELQQDFGMAIMMITHDLGVVSEMADQVAVMYLGVVVEYADAHRLFHNPLHPYLQALLKSLPSMEKEKRRRLEVIKGVVPEPFAIPEGCRFTPRCQYAQGICSEEEPSLKDMGEEHLVACHFAADFIS